MPKTGNNIAVVEKGPRAGVFLCPAADSSMMGTGMVYEVECRVFFDHVVWQDWEGYRVMCIPLPDGSSKATILEGVRHKAEQKGYSRVEVYTISRMTLN